MTKNDNPPILRRALALRYFPGPEPPETKVAHLNRWINRAPDLLRLLEQTGYTSRRRLLTPRQAELIIDFFGDP